MTDWRTGSFSKFGDCLPHRSRENVRSNDLALDEFLRRIVSTAEIVEEICPNLFSFSKEKISTLNSNIDKSNASLYNQEYVCKSLYAIHGFMEGWICPTSSSPLEVPRVVTKPEDGGKTKKLRRKAITKF